MARVLALEREEKKQQALILRKMESRRSLEAHEERMAKGKIAAIAAPGSHPLARQRTEVPGVES